MVSHKKDRQTYGVDELARLLPTAHAAEQLRKRIEEERADERASCVRWLDNMAADADNQAREADDSYNHDRARRFAEAYRDAARSLRQRPAHALPQEKK